MNSDKAFEFGSDPPIGSNRKGVLTPFTPLSMGGHKYFNMFIDNYSQYGFVELIIEISKSLEAFKTFKAKVELQQGKKIKVVHSDIGGEYYGRYHETGSSPRNFQSTFINVTLMLNIQCLVLLIGMG